MDMASLLVLARVVTISFSLHFSISLVIRMEQLQSFLKAHLKLRYSSTPFSKKFPPWSISSLPGCLLMVDPGPGPSVHFPDHDPVFEASSETLAYHRQKFRSQERTGFWGWSSNA